AEGDRVDSHALKHQFGAEEHDDQVPPAHEADHADREHDRSDGEIMLQGELRHHVSGYSFCRGFRVPTTGMLCGLSSMGVIGATIASLIAGETSPMTRRRAITIAPIMLTVRINPARSTFTRCF